MLRYPVGSSTTGERGTDEATCDLQSVDFKRHVPDTAPCVLGRHDKCLFTRQPRSSLSHGTYRGAHNCWRSSIVDLDNPVEEGHLVLCVGGAWDSTLDCTPEEPLDPPLEDVIVGVTCDVPTAT